MGNQQYCCTGAKDKHAQDFGENPRQQEVAEKPVQDPKEKEEQGLVQIIAIIKQRKLEHKVIKLQAVFRGHMNRKRIRRVRDIIDSRPLLSNRSVNFGSIRRVDFGVSKYARELRSMPDYSTPARKLAEDRLGPFIHHQDGRQQDGQPRLEESQVVERGPFELDTGAVYLGQWTREGLREGRGIQLWRDGTKYEGFWRNDQANGLGRLIHVNGDSYFGYFLNDRAHGRGVYEYQDGSRFIGDWKNDIQDGFGIETWSDNSKFEGSYSNGKKHGIGFFKWSDGSFYFGEFKDNVICGKGIYTWPDMRRYEGDWKHSLMHGNGLFLWPDGRRYQGEYSNDRKHGYGEFIWPDGRWYKGEWRAGKQHGQGLYNTSQGHQKFGEWNDGKRERWLGSQQQAALRLQQENQPSNNNEQN